MVREKKQINNMEKKKIYEYLIVKEYFGSLNKGCRLYYYYDKQGYLYHTEYGSCSKSDRYECKEYSTTDYFISIDIADKYLKSEELISGPELGELEYKEDGF